MFSAESGLTAPERSTLAVLLLHRNGETGRCDPSVAGIAAEADLSERCVRDAIKRLEGQGLLDCNRRSGMRTRYVVHVPTPAPVAPLQDVHPCTSSTPPRQEVHPTPAPGAPERTKERTKERTDLFGGIDGRSFPPLDKLPRQGSERLYPPAFEGAFAALPRRHVSHPKADAYSAWRARVGDVEELFQLEAAADAYREDCARRDVVGTEFVMQASTFFGKHEKWKPYSGVEPLALTASAPAAGPSLSRAPRSEL